LKNLFEKRFAELELQAKGVAETYHERESSFSGTVALIDDEKFLEWKVKAKSLVAKVCGTESEHYKEFVAGENKSGFETIYHIFKRVKSVFLAAKEDFEGGYLIGMKSLVQAEVFESELEQAKELIQKGFTVAAAVIAGVVLETGLRELCTKQAIAHASLDKMNVELAKAGVYSMLQQKRITALANIRNSAAHGKQNEFTEEDVKSMIHEVEIFLANYIRA